MKPERRTHATLFSEQYLYELARCISLDRQLPDHAVVVYGSVQVRK